MSPLLQVSPGDGLNETAQLQIPKTPVYLVCLYTQNACVNIQFVFKKKGPIQVSSSAPHMRP